MAKKCIIEGGYIDSLGLFISAFLRENKNAINDSIENNGKASVTLRIIIEPGKTGEEPVSEVRFKCNIQEVSDTAVFKGPDLIDQMGE